MAAYFKATQLMRGCHLPLLYIGVECGLTKNIELAENFFYQAMSIAPLDVNVLHELGVIKFEYEKWVNLVFQFHGTEIHCGLLLISFHEAEEILQTTLNMVMKMAQDNHEPISPRWEPLLNNLAHCCRKNKKYDDALRYHEQALILKPQSSATYTAMGLVYAIKGELRRAIDYLHRSLALKRDDIVTTRLLKQCIEESADDDKELSDWQDDADSSVNTIEDIKRQGTSSITGSKLKGMKISFDDIDDSNDSSDIDPDPDMDMTDDWIECRSPSRGHSLHSSMVQNRKQLIF